MTFFGLEWISRHFPHRNSAFELNSELLWTVTKFSIPKTTPTIAIPEASKEKGTFGRPHHHSRTKKLEAIRTRLMTSPTVFSEGKVAYFSVSTNLQAAGFTVLAVINAYGSCIFSCSRTRFVHQKMLTHQKLFSQSGTFRGAKN